MDEDSSLESLLQEIFLTIYRDTDISVETVYVHWSEEGLPIVRVSADIGKMEVKSGFNKN